MSRSTAEIQRICRLLEALLVLSKVQPQEVATRLGSTPGTLRRLLAGEIELKLRHILDILEALGISPATFFRVAYDGDPGAGRTPTEDAEATVLMASRMRQARRGYSREDLVEIVEATILRLAGPPKAAWPTPPKTAEPPPFPPDGEEDPP